MKKLIQTFSLLIFSLCFTSCFEITEEVDMNANGSGQLTLTLNMSESKDNLAKFMKQGEVEGVKLPQQADIDKSLSEVKAILASMDGISDVSLDKDYQEFIFTLSGNFSNVTALNNAVNGLAEKMNKSSFATIKRKNYSFSNGKFIRHFDYPIEPEKYNKLGTMERFVMETARLISIYRFDQPVKNQTNAKAKISRSKKSVMMMNTIGDIAKGESTLATQISFE